jgi:hypothetical protein
MNTFEAFNKVTEEQKVKDEENRIRNERFQAQLQSERDNLEKSLLEKLMPFNEQTVVIGDKIKKLSVKLKKNKYENVIELYIDDNLSFEFLVERRSSSCSCEGPCDHETRYWYCTSVNEINNEKRKGIYFNAGSADVYDDVTVFAESMRRLLDSTRWTR